MRPREPGRRRWRAWAGPSATLVVLAVLAACAPAAGRPAVAYLAAPKEVIRAVAQFGPTMQPPTGYNYFSVETIGDGRITLRSDRTTVRAILGTLSGDANAPAHITVTTLEQERVTSVAISVVPSGLGGLYDRVLQELDMRFRRAPSVSPGWS